MITYLQLLEYLNNCILVFQQLENEKASSAWKGNKTDEISLRNA